MWAQVSNNEVVRVLAHPSNIESDGVTHPKSIFTKWSAADLKAVGIYPYSSNLIDTRYHYSGELSYDVGGDSVTGTYTTIDKDIADLKTTMINNLRSAAASILARDDWMSIRESEGGTAMDSDIKTYRAAIRTESGTKETEINALADLDAVKSYEATSYTEVRKVAEYDADGKFTGYGSETESNTRHINMSTYYEAVDPSAEADPSFVSLTKD